MNNQKDAFLEEKTDILEKIKQTYSRFSKSQKMIGDYILSHYDKAAFMTAAKLGEESDVSESTVVRFAIALGYSGYPTLQKALQEVIKTKLTTIQRMELSDNQVTQDTLLKDTFESDIKNIQSTLDELQTEEFSKVVQTIYEAKRIYIIGFRTTTILTEFLGFYLNLILDNVTVVTYGISDIFEQLIHVKHDDVIIGISFPRYSKKTTEILEFVKEKGAKVVTITDSDLSPLTEYSDYNLIAKSDMLSFVDSLVAPLSLINALIISLGMKEKDKIKNIFNDLENAWERYGIYTSKEKIDVKSKGNFFYFD